MGRVSRGSEIANRRGSGYKGLKHPAARQPLGRGGLLRVNSREPEKRGVDGEGKASGEALPGVEGKRALLLSCALEEPYRILALEGDVVDFCGFERDRFRDPAFGISRMHPADRARLPESKRGFEEQGRGGWDFRWLHADGRYRSLHVEARLFPDERGVPVELLACVVRRQRGKVSPSAFVYCARMLEEQTSRWGFAILRNLEQSRVAQAALRASEERFRALFDQAPHGVLVCWEGKFLEANETICRMLGYTREELLALKLADIEVGLSEEEVFGTLRGEDGRPVTFLGRHRRKDGMEYAAEVHVSGYLHQGRPARLAIIRDVSTVQQLSESLVLRTAALEETSDGILITTGRSGTCPVVYASRSFEALSGLNREEVLGKCGLELLRSGGGIESSGGEVAAALTAGRGYQGELHVPWHGGSGCWLFVRIKPIESGNGGERHFIWWFVDVTAQKSAEMQAAAQRELLMRMGRLASVGEVSVHVAHQLGQPLSAMVGNLEVVRSHVSAAHGGDPMLKGVVDDLFADCRRLQETVHRVGALVRPEASVPEETCLGDLLRGVVVMLRQEIQARRIDLRTSLASKLPVVFVDRVQIQQVVMNLLVNAFEAVQELPVEKREVEMTVQATDCGVEVAVLDRGPGIPVEHLDRVFDPLFTTKEKGIGMGLCLCRTIANLHGGRVTAENRPGGGAILRFFVPAMESRRPLPHNGERGR